MVTAVVMHMEEEFKEAVRRCHEIDTVMMVPAGTDLTEREVRFTYKGVLVMFDTYFRWFGVIFPFLHIILGPPSDTHE